ncbi:hypothetical protein K450DRAFT_242493 [Umbelopsis ramanniana AG]|uniref:Uncharacterized protein n=1 Tax=Umbelopsis ramanniana AG TaxID=1314678 RepID=A0AAD5E8W1_UMBRA|nr:uncharacterized protein K450DRAFT_242493 [Umbelopsis ramanniana AG]KAI8579278.1 hypothetical protein K450DRAFT_242493 [Umbelopsis ramanniana AG]
MGTKRTPIIQVNNIGFSIYTMTLETWKLQRPPQEVLAWYKQSVDRCKPSLGQHGHHEVILEPIYKLCAVLIKYLYRHQIQPNEVASYLEESDKDDGEKQDSDMMDHSANHDEESVNNNTAEIPNYRESQNSDHHHDNDTVDGEQEHEEHEETTKTIQSSHSIAHLKSEEAAAYQLIFDRLAMVRKIDRRHWHHRPIFRHAWMHYYIYRDAEQAKADMMPLFALKSNLKSHISIWKPGFERPGKHFEYAHQYTVFMIELAQVTNDANTLKILCRKLRKNQPVLLYDKEIYGAAYTAYLEVIQNYLHKHHNSQQKQSSVIGVIPKAPFERKCDEWLKAIVAKEPKPELLVLLTDLFDIKKLNQGHVSDLNSDELIRQCLIALLFAETGIKQELVDVIIPVVDGNSFRIIERDGSVEDIKRNDLEGPKVIPANIFHQATRLYRWPPTQRSKPSANETNKNGLTTPAGTVSSEPGLNDSGSPAQHPASTAPRSETPPPQAMQVDTEDDTVPARSSLPITDLLSSG